MTFTETMDHVGVELAGGPVRRDVLVVPDDERRRRLPVVAAIARLG